MFRARESELETLGVERTVEAVAATSKWEEDNVVLPLPRDSRLTFRARESELETLGVERTVEAVAATSQRSLHFNKKTYLSSHL
ncbi:hypothetical protein NDU88_004841 [Pleurodeles waltl]|uniref:Uncharacterized protein n=1 Tax=Pleurodeles waltl TaxID=8319 RepID=A0AAV7VK99_PLEWA|nr:hypothetical protein NDU88_004841 [Pleurodeles waltl]